MNRDEILDMEPSRELDALVAEKVMGWETVNNKAGIPVSGFDWVGHNPKTQSSTVWSYVPDYSTDISAAWEVVEKLSRGKVDRSFVLEFHYERYYASFGPYREEMYETPSEAICKAALLAVLEDINLPEEGTEQ